MVYQSFKGGLDSDRIVSLHDHVLTLSVDVELDLSTHHECEEFERVSALFWHAIRKFGFAL